MHMPNGLCFKASPGAREEQGLEAAQAAGLAAAPAGAEGGAALWPEEGRGRAQGLAKSLRRGRLHEILHDFTGFHRFPSRVLAFPCSPALFPSGSGQDRVVQLSIRNEREELESSHARRSETEVRKRIGGQEEKMQQLKDQAAPKRSFQGAFGRISRYRCS